MGLAEKVLGTLDGEKRTKKRRGKRQESHRGEENNYL